MAFAGIVRLILRADELKEKKTEVSRSISYSEERMRHVVLNRSLDRPWFVPVVSVAYIACCMILLYWRWMNHLNREISTAGNIWTTSLLILIPMCAALPVAMTIRLFNSRFARPPQGGPELPVSCPSCGAPGVLTFSAQADRCHHCQSVLIPDHGQQQLARERLERASDQADHLKYRAQITADILEEDTYKSQPPETSLKITSICLFVCGFGLLVANLAGMAINSPVPGEIDHTSIIWVIVVLSIVGAFVIEGIRWRVNRRRLSTMQNIAEAFGSPAAWGGRGLVNWIRSYWWGKYPYKLGRGGSQQLTLTKYVQGFPITLSVNLWPTEGDPGYFDYSNLEEPAICMLAPVYAANEVPALRAPRALLRAPRAWSAQTCDGGVILRWEGDSAGDSRAMIAKDPAAWVRDFVDPAVEALVATLRAQNCVPRKPDLQALKI